MHAVLLYKKVTLRLCLQICLQIAEDITIRYPGLNKGGEGGGKDPLKLN